MVKQRLTSADIAAEVACLRARIVGLRIANTYVFKLARSGEEGEKVFLMVESGARMHTIEGMPVKGDTPSNFTLKLRKHLRTRRVESVRQLGIDRVVQLSVGSGPTAHHLILEFFAQGNVVLTDASYTVLTLLRSHRDDDAGLAIMAAHPYPVHAIRARRGGEAPALRLAAALAEAAADGGVECATGGEGKTPETLRAALVRSLPYGPAVAEHVARAAGLDPGAPLADCVGSDTLAALVAAATAWERWLASLQTDVPRGYIVTSDGDDAVYESVEPILLAQHEGRHTLEFDTFDAAMDAFFGKISGQRAVQAKASKERAARGKLVAVERDAAGRLAALESEAASSEGLARAIEANLALADAALESVREALAGGMAWVSLEKLVREEAAAGNPVAAVIASMQLDKGKVTLLLPNPEEEEEDEGCDGPAPGTNSRRGKTRVTLDLALSAHANARVHYDARRKHNAKKERTLAANDKAIKAAERKSAAQLKQVHSAPVAAIARKPYWFERFSWFISSENFLVLSGRDAQQNELLVKRYMKRGDVYCHADLHGASSTIVKNHAPDVPIPPLTLAQAGAMCVCRSAAWNAKVVTSAWWVHPEQVSRTAPTGEYLTTGSFMIRGRKNYLPPQPLVVGFGLLFRLDDSCIAHHLGERAPKSGEEGEAALDDGGRYGTRPADPAGWRQEAEVTNDVSDLEAPAAVVDPLAAFLESGLEALPLSSRAGGRQSMDAMQSQFQRYGLGEHSSAAGNATAAGDEEDGSETQRKDGGGVRHLSAKERQARKAGAAPGPAAARGTATAAKAAVQEPAPQSAGAAKSRRGAAAGKRGGSKYFDEEDAELARQALQSGGPAKSRRQRKAEHKAKLAAKRTSQSTLTVKPVTADDIARATDAQFEEMSGKESGEEGGGPAGGAGDAGRGAEEDGSTAPPSAGPGSAGSEGDGGSGSSSEEEEGVEPVDEEERAEVAALLAEENVKLLDEEDRDRLTQLDALTGAPRPDDILLYALPVCAPYQVLASYKYKVKMIPGTQKKGKALRQAMELFSKSADATQREKDLAKAVPEPEAVTTLVGTVKIQAAGVQKLKQGAKKKK